MEHEIQSNAKMLANEFSSRTNLYPPAQLMEGVTTEAQAAARFKKLGAPPTVLYENGEKLSEKVFQETAEGIYGKGAKSFIQSYEDAAGKVWYKDAKTGKIRKGFVDLVHLKEGYGKYTAEGVASNAQQWALKAEHAMEHGDYRSAFKYTRRIEKDLTKGTDLARLDKVKTRSLKKFVGKLDAIEFMNRGLPPAEKTKAINEAISKLLENPATRRELFQSIREARLQAELLHSLSVTKNPWAKTFIRDTLQESTPAAKKFLGILDKNSLKNVPVGKILTALFVYMDLKDASQKAGRGEDDEAARKILEGSLFAMGSMGPATAAMVTNIFLDWVKERGFAVSTVMQDCEDLLAQIIEVKGWESADSFGSGGETDIETLAREVVEEKKIREIVKTSIFNATSRGSNTSKISEGKIKPLYSRCSEEIVTKWRNRRAEIAGDYLMSLQKLRELVKASTGIVQIEPNPALLLKRKGEDEKSASVDVTAELLSPQSEKILLLAKRVKQKAKLLGGRHNQTSVGFYKKTQWFMDGKKWEDEEKSYSWENPVSKKSLVFDKPGEHNITCEVEWSVHLQSTIVEAGTHTFTTIHPLNAIMKYGTIAGMFVDLPVTTTATKRGDVLADNQKFTSFSTKSLLSGKIIINDSDLDDSLKVYIKGLSTVLPSKRIMLMATVESAAKIDMEKLRFVWSKNVEADGLSAFFESSKTGRKIVTVEVYKGKEKMAESYPFHIDVVDPGKATFSFEITGPSDVKDIEQDITLHTIVNGTNGAGKLLLSDKDTWIEWIVDNKVVEGADAVRIGFPSAGRYIVTARLMREVNGQTISLADAMHTVKVEKKMTDELAKKELADDTGTNTTSPGENTKTVQESEDQDTTAKDDNLKSIPPLKDKVPDKSIKNNSKTGETKPEQPKVQNDTNKNSKIVQNPDKKVDFKDEAERETEKVWISKIEEAFKGRDCVKMKQLHSKLMLYGKNKMAIGYKYPVAGKLLSKHQAQMAKEKEKWFKKDVLEYLRKIISLIMGQNPYNKAVSEGRSMTDSEEACSKIVRSERKSYEQIIQEHKKTLKKLFDLQGQSIEICTTIEKFIKKYEIPISLKIPQKYQNICNIKPQNHKFSVKVSGQKNISLSSRESVTLEAIVVGGQNPVTVSWEGDNISPNGSTAIFAATIPGSYTVQVVAKDAGGQSVSDAVSIRVKQITMPVLSGLPNEVYYGTSKIVSAGGTEANHADDTSGGGVDCTKNPNSPFCVDTSTGAVKKPCKNPFDEDCNVKISQDSDGKSAGAYILPPTGELDIPNNTREDKEQFEYIWQPSGGDGLEFDPPSGNKPKVKVTFGNIGNIEIWAQIKKNGEYIGDTEPIKTKVIPPKLTLTVKPEAPYIGEASMASIKVEPDIDNKYLDFRWLPMGKNIQELGESNGGRSYRLKVKNNHKSTIEVLVWAQPYAEEQIADLKQVISAKPYNVDVKVLGPLGPKPRVWKEGKGLVEVEGAIAIHQNVRLKATVEPKPKSGLRYIWTLNEDSHFAGGSSGSEVTVNRSQVGTCVAAVTVKDGDGDVLGKGNASFSVTVSQQQIDKGKQKSKDQKKSKELLQKARKLWKEGKLQQAIDKATQGRKLAEQDRETAKTLKAMQIQKKELDTKLDKASALIRNGKQKDAEAILSQAARISEKYDGYKKVLKQLSDAKKKAEDDKKKLGKLLKEAKIFKDVGKLNRAVKILIRGQRLFPDNKGIAKLLKSVQKQQKALAAKIKAIREAAEERARIQKEKEKKDALVEKIRRTREEAEKNSAQGQSSTSKIRTGLKGSSPSKTAGNSDDSSGGYWKLVEKKGSIGRECTRKERYNDYYRDTISGFGTHITITNMIRKGNEVYCKHEAEWKQPPEKLYPGTTIKSPVTIKRLAYTGRYGCDMSVSFDPDDLDCGSTYGNHFGSVKQNAKDLAVLHGEVIWKVKDPIQPKAGDKLTIRACFSGGSICGKPGFWSYYEWVPKGSEVGTPPSNNNAVKKIELAKKIKAIREAAKERARIKKEKEKKATLAKKMSQNKKSDIIVGQWRNPKGVIIRFDKSPSNEYRATMVYFDKKLLSYGFRKGEVGYRLRYIGGGKYRGKGKMHHRDGSITWKNILFEVRGNRILNTRWRRMLPY